MDISRKDFITMATASAAVQGCTTLPGASVVYSGAHAVGGAVGLILKGCKLSDKSKSAIVSITKKIVAIVPDVGQTAENAWGAAAKEHVALLIAEGKITSLTGAISLAAFTLLVKAFTLIEAKYPQALAVRKVLEAAVDGFGKGIIASLDGEATSSQAYDQAAYDSMKASTLLSVIRMLSQIESEESNG